MLYRAERFCSLILKYWHDAIKTRPYKNICFEFWRWHFSLVAVQDQCGVSFCIVNFEKWISKKKRRMALLKEVVSFILLLILSRFFVSGGRITNPIDSIGRFDERKSGEQRNFAISTTWPDPNFATDFKPYQNTPKPTITTTTTAKTTTIKVDLDVRNNFGDLPVKCGPNQEKIHGECQDV